MSVDDAARPRAVRERALRTVVAAVLVAATALGGTPALAQETTAEPPPETTTTAPADVTPSDTPVETTTTTTSPETQPVSPPTADRPAAPTGEHRAAGAEPEAESAAEADLRITASFDRAEYPPETDLPIRVTVDNVGDDVATEVEFVVFDGNVWLRDGWDQISGRFTLVPGERMVVDLVARPLDHLADHAQFTIRVFRAEGTIPDPTPADNQATARAVVAQKRGAVSAVVYTDGNGNGRADAGEGVPGLHFSAYGGAPVTSLTAVTDGGGRLAFTDVPTGRYRLYLPDDDVVVKPGFGEFTVEEGATADLAIPTATPVSDVLTARLELDRDTYGRDYQVNVRITLANSGTVPLTGVVAVCNHAGEPHVLDGTGPGWAPLAVGGPGTTVGAGETKVLVVTDVVPQRAYERGFLFAECNFGNHGTHEDGYVGSSDSARVVGARGDATGLLRYYSGQGPETPLAGVRLLALDRFGVPVAEAVSGDDGEWRFVNLPVGDYDVLVLGPYRDRYGSDTYTIGVDAGGTSRSIFSVVDGPVVVPPRLAPNVKVTASFGKPSYDINEQVTATVKVVNAGTARTFARFVPESSADGFHYDHDQWGDLRPWLGAYLEPGDERTVTLVGDVAFVREGVAWLKGRIEATDEADPADNVLGLSVPVTHRTGDVVAVVYGDRDLDGVFDQGEALPGVDITFEGGRPRKWVAGETGADGTYRLDDAPAGTYVVITTDEHTGWVSQGQSELVVTGDQETTAYFRMERPLSDRLHATLAFDRDTYGVGDPVDITITLANSGDAPILARAFCGSAELPAPDYGAAWGPFAPDGSGVVVAPGGTRAFTVRETVPGWAGDYGLFGAWCDFGPEHANGLAHGSDLARVPGAVWTVSGRALNGTGPEPRGIPGVKLVLLDFITGQPVARTVTGADGGFTFTDLPVGYYTPVLVGPWKFNTNWGPYAYFKVVRGGADVVDIHFDPGPEVPDPDVPPTGEPIPGQPAAGGGPSGGGLADTGASVLWLSLLGLLAVALGAGTRTAGRRRTA
ncbi:MULTISPECIES: hypothetical protein [Saccharothrix]|uniref:hypothetical protein n=1 Tax=Saccharothrix TaxID=2071 RepID=UPI00093DCDBD|nr:hypothetical protein [Saccharothrix sp. CB00851]